MPKEWKDPINSTPMIRLGLNIDHVATLRQARYAGLKHRRGGIIEPDPVAYALEAQRAGADGITVHPREDGRHIQRDDVLLLKDMLQVPLNMEMGCTDSMLEFALEVLPNTVCLVPEKREEVTTEGGLDIAQHREAVADIIEALEMKQVKTSLFIDPDPAQIAVAIELRPAYIELHTGAYANAYGTGEGEVEFQRLVEAAAQARAGGLVVNLGHGINYTNIVQLRAIEGIYEMNIGHSIISRSVFDGLQAAVSTMKHLMNGR